MLALRRPDFVPGTPVLLLDGQEWQLRRPLVWFEPSDTDFGFRVSLTPDPAGDDFQALMERRDALFDKQEQPTTAAVAAVDLTIAWRMLAANYDLSAKQAGRLLQFSYDLENELGCGLRRAVLDVAWGNGPRTIGRWYRCASYAAGGLQWPSPMLLEDYLDAIAFREHGRVPPQGRWVDELRYAANMRSFDGVG